MRRAIVEAVRGGQSQRSVAKQFGCSLRKIQRWVERARSKQIDDIDFMDRPPGARHSARRTNEATEQLVVAIRSELRDKSALGEFGAVAIREELVRRHSGTPSVRTIGRILVRTGTVQRTKRVRHPPPCPGWYLPPVAAVQADLDSFDTINGLVIRGGTQVTVLTGVSVLGNQISAWPRPQLAARDVLELILDRWSELGLPGYAQFDNDTLFQGPHQYADVIGRVMRTCLSLGVTPVFAPPREPGFQNAIESLNGRWQSKVWSRFEHASLADLTARSDAFIAAHRARSRSRQDALPPRRPLESRPVIDLQKHPEGTVVFLRRLDDQGNASLLGRTFHVSSSWAHRLVRAEVDLARGIAFHSLSRRTPDIQTLLANAEYRLPRRRFKE